MTHGLIDAMIEERLACQESARTRKNLELQLMIATRHDAVQQKVASDLPRVTSGWPTP
jgi:hypothetical protein